jgi:hypothetical protein
MRPSDLRRFSFQKPPFGSLRGAKQGLSEEPLADLAERRHGDARILATHKSAQNHRKNEVFPSPTVSQNFDDFLLEHLVRDQGVGGSNPLSPTNYPKRVH